MNKLFGAAFLAAVCTTIMVTQSGCLVAAAAAVGGTAYAFADGELTDRVSAGPEKVVEATKAAMNDLKLTVLSSRADGVEGLVEGRVGADNKATIKVKSEGTNVSKINIRVGTFGDETTSKQILEKIKAHL